ncbi:MAG: flavodoxin [Faecalibacterium sp. CAG:82-related_59_9]|nr:MAG: flavodoxin [Faecalibacterium sp. CAG:82-related_59_9]
MSVKHISSAILGVGVDDTTIDLFESQYPVPTGVSYNSYVILDEKTTILDTVDHRATEEWLANLTEALDGRKPEYLIVSHMEPDHGANIAKLAAALYPEMQVVGNAKTFQYMEQFFGAEAIAKERRVVVKDGESLSLGAHTLTFVFAPMVHWPEVMVSYESSEKVLFSADGFGRFGAVAKFEEKADWASEARRYYLNIVGKYGPQVQALLKKAAALDIKTICPLHGPVLTGDLGKYLNYYYDMWSSYKPEEPEKILVASASIHGHTRSAAHILAEKLRAKGAKVVEMDLTRTDVSYAVTEAFRCGKTVLACATYDGFLSPPMEALLTHLKTKNFQNRTVGLMENGTWAPMAAKLMRAELDGMKNMTVCDTVVTLRSASNAAAEAQMDAMVDELLSK